MPDPANRIGVWWGGTLSSYNEGHGAKYTGNSLILFAPGTGGFDLIVSKYGLGEGHEKHHF